MRWLGEEGEGEGEREGRGEGGRGGGGVSRCVVLVEWGCGEMLFLFLTSLSLCGGGDGLDGERVVEVPGSLRVDAEDAPAPEVPPGCHVSTTHRPRTIQSRPDRTRKQRKGRKGREGSGRERKGGERKGAEGKGGEGRGREGKGGSVPEGTGQGDGCPNTLTHPGKEARREGGWEGGWEGGRRRGEGRLT